MGDQALLQDFENNIPCLGRIEKPAALISRKGEKVWLAREIEDAALGHEGRGAVVSLREHERATSCGLRPPGQRVVRATQHCLIRQFHIPVSKIDKVFPRIIAGFAELEVKHRSPLRALRFMEQLDPSFGRRAVALAAVAGDAGANDVLP